MVVEVRHCIVPLPCLHKEECTQLCTSAKSAGNCFCSAFTGIRQNYTVLSLCNEEKLVRDHLCMHSSAVVITSAGSVVPCKTVVTTSKAPTEQNNMPSHKPELAVVDSDEEL